MSYLARLAARMAGPRAAIPPVVPKGVQNPQPATVARAEETGEEEETVSPMRPLAAHGLTRQTEEEGEEVSRQAGEEEPEAEMAASRRMAVPVARREADEPAEEDVAPLRRQEGEEEEAVAPLRRQEEEEEAVAPLRRQAGEEEEAEVAPLRRQEAEEDPEARPMRAIARQEEVPLEETGRTAPPRTQADLEPDAEPPSEELAGEREPSNLQALRRDLSPGPGPALSSPALPGPAPPSESRSANESLAETMAPPNSQMAHFTDGIAIPPAGSQGIRAEESRPNVTIDQLDVLINEPAMPAERVTAHRDRDRALRARYLRRL